jgi:hypothetical protein
MRIIKGVDIVAWKRITVALTSIVSFKDKHAVQNVETED